MKGTMAPRTPGLRKVMDRMFDPLFAPLDVREIRTASWSFGCQRRS